MSFSEWSNNKKKKKETEASQITVYEATSQNAGIAGSSFSEWSNNKKSKEAEESAIGWINASRNLLTEVQGYYQNWTNDDTQYRSFQDRASSLLSSADNWRKQYAGNDEVNDIIDSVVYSLSHLKRYAMQYQDYYAKWDTEEAYNQAVEQAKADEKKWTELTGGYDPVKNREEGRVGWEAYVSPNDKAEKEASERAAEEEKAEEEDSWEQFLEDLGRWMGPGTNPDTSLPFHLDVNLIAQEYNDKEIAKRFPDERWTDDQRYTYGYLLSKFSKTKAGDYAYAVNNMLNVQQEQEQLQQIMEWATTNFGTGAVSTVGAILAAPTGLADYLGDVIQEGTLGYIPEADGTISPFEFSQAVTSGIGTHLNTEYGTLNENIPIIGGKGWGDLYGLGTSIAQSSLAAFSGGQGQALITFFGSAAASGVDDAVKRGATGGQAVAYGSMLGLAEGLAEMIGIDNLMKIGSSATVKQLVLNILKQGAAEGIEEGVTSVLNNFADNLIMGDKSNFNILVSYYMDKGMSEEDAKKKAWTDAAEGIAFDMVGGFVSGATHSGVKSTASYIGIQNQYRKTGSAIKGADGGVDALMNLANEVAGVSSADMQKTLNDQIGKVNKNDTNRRVGRLYNTVWTANNQANAPANQADIAKSLMRNNFSSEQANAIAEALVANQNGQELTKAQKKLIRSVQYNEDVRDAVANIIDNPNSTMGQRSQKVRNIVNSAISSKNTRGTVNREENASEDPSQDEEIDYDFSDSDFQSFEFEYLRETARNLLEEDKASGNIDSFAYDALIERYGKDDAKKDATRYQSYIESMSGELIDRYDIYDKYLAQKPSSQNIPESSYDVSDDGNAYLKSSPGEAISINGIVSIKNGHMTLMTEDGNTIDAGDVSFGSQSEALVYEAVANLEGIIDTDTANKLAKHLLKLGDTTSSTYVDGIVQAYTYGYKGYGRNVLSSKDALFASLSEKQRNVAYGRGKMYGEAKTAADQENSRKATVSKKNAPADETKATAPDGTQYKNVRFLGDIHKWGKKQSADVATVDFITSDFSGNTVYVFESYKNKDGEYVYKDNDGNVHSAPNGWYISSTGDIYLDLNAGWNGEGLVMNTFAHELYHHIEKRSPAKAKALAEFLVQEFGYENVEKAVQRQIDKAARKGHGVEFFMKEEGLSRSAAERLVYDRAFSDFIADSLETMFTEGDAFEKLQKLKKQDEGLFAMIKNFITQWVKKLRKFYKDHSTLSIEGGIVAHLEKFEQIQQMFVEALVDAGDNFRAAQEQFSTDSIRANADGAVPQSEVTTALVDSADDLLLSERTEYEALPKQVMSLSDGAGKILHFIEGLVPKKLKGLSNKTINGYTGRDVRAYAMGISGFTKKQIGEVNKFMDAMSEFMEKAGVTYRFIGLQDVRDAQLHYTYNPDGSIKSIVLSAMVKNGDYPVNFDLSSICKKRVAMSKLIDKLAQRGSLDNGTVKLTPANIFKINTALKNEGYETACLGCFVESKRYNSLEWAKKFCNKWNAAVKKVNPNATYFDYGNATFSEDSFTLEQAVKIDAAATKYITATKTERLENALAKYKAKEDAGLPLVEGKVLKVDGEDLNTFSKAARERLVKSDTISDELKAKYLNCDVSTLNMADVEFLLENGILPGATLSNKQAVTELVKSGEPYQHLLRPSDLLTDRGISKLEALPNFHGVLYGHYGSGTPKLMQSYTPYNSEIALLPASKGDLSLAEYLYSIAGVRMQSFSDFQIQNIYDYLQMVADLAARKLPAHAYTKEISFAKLLGMTGIKVNLSVMFDIDPMVDKAHAGLTKLNKLVHRGEYARVVLEDEQGRWVYNIGDYQTQRMFAEAFPDEAKRFLQSIGFADAVKLQSSPGYSSNCGIIGVGYSDLGIVAMLNDNRIRYIIPYHASSLPSEIKLATHIALGTDYTPYQNNMKITNIVDRNGKKVDWTIKEAYKRLGSGQAVINELNDKVRNEGWVVTTKKSQTGHGTYGLYEDLQQTNDPRQTVSNFMDWCIGNSTLPLFYQFASHENYYKLLYDFNVYDCVTEEYAPQQAVTNTYPTMVDGQVQPGTVTDGGFDAEYFTGTIDKQMAFMNEYSRNLNDDLEQLADNLENGTLYSDRGDNAPTFYSHMARVVDAVKQEKLGAASVVNMLRGKGVKAEEIKWSGIEEWLAGKKSVTKAELQEFIAGSMLQVREQISGGSNTKWSDYKLPGGANYREITFTLPNSYSNQIMRKHWGNDAHGVLAHARIQDFVVRGKKMLFIEEIQSDWHNEGHKTGYHDTPDAPFRDTYHEFVLKRLIRMAAEEGYDGIGWTPAQIQVERWSEEFAEGFRIEYDQDIPKFLNKYGKKWGAKAGKTDIRTKQLSQKQEANLDMLANILEVGEDYIRSEKGIKEVWAMPITDSMKASVMTEGQPMYSERDTESISNRYLLANAFEGIAKPDERQKIQEYKDKIDLINEEERKLRELNDQIKELSFAKGPRDKKKISALRFDANQAANRINTYDKQLLRLEASQPLQDVLAREKKLAYKKAEQRGKEALAAYKAKAEKKQKEIAERYRESRKQAVAKAKETADKREARAKLQKLVLDTVNWISYPAKTDVKCPDILKKPYEAFLKGIDLSSKRLANGGEATKNDLRLANAMDSLATALDKIITAQNPTTDPNKVDSTVLDAGYLDLPTDFVQDLRDMTEKIKSMMVEGEYVVNNMTAAEVRQLSQMIRTLNHSIKTMSTLYANLRFANVEALVFDTIDFLDALGEIEKTGGMKDFIQWDNALPYYAFKRFGKGGESIFEGLMDAQDKLAFLAKDIFAFREKTWTGKEAKAWSEDTHTIDLPNGNKLTLTTADAMSIYCLSRREHALPHLLGGGIRVMGIQKGSKKSKDSRSLLTIQDVDAIISSLTDRQKQVAEGIQEFMSTVCSEWGNEISMKRFLTKEFNEKFYFPIESNDENLTVRDPAAQQSDLFRLLNISATKPLTQGANNEVIIRNIFDVFTGHASDMARLNAYGMGLLDYMKWLNYREKTSTEEGQIKVKGVRKSIETAYGNAANSYVLNLIKDVNGRPSDGGDPTILMKWMRAAKTAGVGNSLRVATLQITSYPRAALVLSPRSLALGLTKIPNIERAKKYCGIALWKSFGFYDTNISRSIEDQMKGVTNIKQKLIELSLKGAEIGDALTWGALWNACEYEVAKTTTNKVGSEEFYQEVGKKLREVVYRTQVVDSTLTRSQIMRSKRGMAQEATAFMSEPTLSANILMDAGFEFGLEKRRTGSAKAAWKKTGFYVGRAIAVYTIGQVTAALLEAFWDAWRDDEDEEFKKKYLSALVTNLALDILPINKIPIISGVADAALSIFDIGYFSADSMHSAWLTQTVSAVDSWKKVFSGESSTTVYNALYKSARAVSSMLGISISGVMREGVALWNNTAGAYDTTLKVRQYDLSKSDLGRELYYAIISGETNQADSLKAQFEDQDALSSAIRKALRENDPRIREAAEAQINGDPSERVRIATLIIADGFSQDDVVWAINSEINDMTPSDSESAAKKKGFYTAEDFAIEIANGDKASAAAAKEDIIQTAQSNGKDEDAAEQSFINSAKTKLKEQYVAGNLSEIQAVDALKTYCQDDDDPMDDNDIYWLLKEWKYEKETGSADGYGKYNDFHNAVKTGKNLKAVIADYTGHGVTAKTLASQITTYFKPLYKKMSNYERANLKGYLLNAYAILGYNRDEKSKDIDKWLKD